VARFIAPATRDWPAPLPEVRRARERPHRDMAGARVIGLAASAIAAATFALAMHTDRSRPASVAAELAEALARLGLGIDEAVVQGHQLTVDDEIFDALDLINARSWLGFDSAAARARIERLAWVRTATVSRVFPGRIEVRITERTPAAVWRQPGRDVLIDGSGRVLGAVGRGAAAHLPIVAGSGAAADASRILALIAAYPAIESRLVEAELVAERRWTLHLDGGLALLLPAEAPSPALARFVAEPGAEQLIAGHQGEIDLRVAQRVSVRPTASRR